MKNVNIYLFNVNTSECRKPVFRNEFKFEKNKEFEMYDDENNPEELKGIMLDYKSFKSFYKITKNIILFYELEPVELKN